MYQNTNTNRAIRDFNQMLISMPEQRSMRDYRSAMARGEDLKSQAAMKQAEMAMPAMKIQSQEAQDKLDIYNSPFHASQIFGNVGGDLGRKGFSIANPPDKGIMWVEHQKDIEGIGQVPPAYQQALENIERYHGYKLTKDGVFVNSKGEVLPNRLAGPILNEARRIQSLNTDPIKARDNRVALLQDAVKSGKLSDDDVKRAQAEIDGLSKTDEVSLREAYLNRLNQWKAEDEQFGRQSKLMEPMINEQVQKIAELKSGRIKKSDREFELEKVRLQNQGKIDAARAKVMDNEPTFTKARLQDISKSIAKIDEAITTRTMDDGAGGTVKITPNYQAQLLAQRSSLIGEAQSIQGGQPSSSPASQKPTIKPKTALSSELDGMLERAGIDNAEPEADEEVVPEVQESETQKESASFSNVKIGKDGTIWGIDKQGRTRRIMVKPPEKIYNNQYHNPEYEKYLETLKKYNLG